MGYTRAHLYYVECLKFNRKNSIKIWTKDMTIVMHIQYRNTNDIEVYVSVCVCIHMKVYIPVYFSVTVRKHSPKST